MIIMIVLIIYLIGMFLIGIYGSRYSDNLKDYLVAGRRGSMLMITGSFCASHIGSGFIVGMAQDGAKTGFNGIWFGIACAISYFIFSPVMSRMIYAGNFITVSDFLKKRYDSRLVSIGYAVINIISSIGIIAGQIIAGGKLFTAIGINATAGAVVTTLVVIGYASFSGLWGVLITDVIQVGIILFGILFAFFQIVFQGGFHIIATTLPPESFDVIHGGNGLAAIFMLTILPKVLQGLLAQPSIQRVAASKNEKVAVWSPIAAGAILAALSVVPVFIGMYGRSLFPDAEPGVVLFKVIMGQFHPLFSGILIAGLLAAVMSTSDSLMMSITANIVHDIYSQFKTSANEKTMMRGSIAVTVLSGLLALLISLRFNNIISLLSFTYTILVCGCLVPVLGGMWWKKGSAAAAVVSMATGIAAILLDHFNIIKFPYPMFAILPSLLAYILITYIMPKRPDKDNTGKEADNE